MKHKAEIFDQVQYLFQEKKMNDHTLHFEMVCNTSLDLARLKEAIWILFQEIPILSCNYINEDENFYWEKKKSIRIKDILIVTSEEIIYQEMFSTAISEKKAPQLRVCYLDNEIHKLCFTLNHMVSDAAGFKEILYFFCDCYNQKEVAIKASDIKNIWKNRNLKPILKYISVEKKIKTVVAKINKNTKKESVVYPLSNDLPIGAIICKKNLGRYTSQKIDRFAKSTGVTINDIFCTAYLRVIAKQLGKYDEDIIIPMMVDMRKYKKKLKDVSISNQTSMEEISCNISSTENFKETLKKVSKQTKEKKRGMMGIYAFVWLDFLYTIFSEKQAYKILKHKMTNAKITITNIGVLDEKQLRLDGIEVLEAMMCGSIKYRPYIQLALSTYQKEMVLSFSLYGSDENKKELKNILRKIEEELQYIL